MGKELGIKIGRHIRDGLTRPFAVTSSGRIFDWAILDRRGVPEPARKAVLRTLESGSAGEICTAVPLIEDFLENCPELLSLPDHRATPAGILDGPLAPPVCPGNFVCIGLNYADHASESKLKLPERPLVFAKTPNAVTGHNHTIRIPKGCEQPDYEAELAVVIGRRCEHVRAIDAMDCVLGYSCVNDVSARDFQFSDGQWYRGKSCDGFGPLGPWVVTKREAPDYRALKIRCRLNGQLMQESTTQDLIFGVPELIEFISSFITLEPGDVIATGTPPGVGLARKPPVYLKDGDRVEVEIERIGVLRNTFHGGQNE